MTDLNYNPIDRFFEETRISHDTSKGYYDFSTLYLLVRDIKTCFGIDPATDLPFYCSKCNEIVKNRAQWPAVMGILAGIDLLGKFYFGNDRNGVGDRFKGFVKCFFYLNDKDKGSLILYELRNSMLHSFGLYSKRYYITLVANENLPFINIIGSQPKKRAVINVIKLYKQFLNAIKEYYKELVKSSELKANFNKMFIKYGINKQGPLALLDN